MCQQLGFTLKDFMSQLFANRNDSGRGRNMPVHYGSRYPRIVSPPSSNQLNEFRLTSPAHNILPPRHANPPSLRRSLRRKTPSPPKPQQPTQNSSLLFRRGRRQRRRLPRRSQHRSHSGLSCGVYLPKQRVRHFHTDARTIPRRRNRQSRRGLWNRHDPGRRKRHIRHARSNG